MTTPSTDNRPRQAGWAGWLVVLGSAFSVVTAFQVIAGARSLETREAISDLLADGPGGGLDIGVEGAIQVLQASASVAAVVGAMMTVLGIYALRGDRRARLGLSLLALPLFISGMALGGFLTSLAAAATGLLWISPAREWYAGLPLPSSPGAPGGPGRSTDPSRPSPWAAPPSNPPSTPDRVDAPTSTGEIGQPGSGQSADPWTHQNPYAPAPRHTPHTPHTPHPDAGQPAEARPDAVTAAVAITLICSGLVLTLALICVGVAALAPDWIVEEVQRTDPSLAEQGLDRTALLVGIWLSGLFMAAAALLAIVFAIFAFTRRRWAANALIVISFVTVFFGALGTVSSVIALVPVISALVVISCLRRSRTWFIG